MIQTRCWVAAIAATQPCMLANPNQTAETYGLLVSGREFVFVKLTNQHPPIYSVSPAFSIMPPSQQIETVLQILKYLGHLLTCP